jgi:hypothetical protein
MAGEEFSYSLTRVETSVSFYMMCLKVSMVNNSTKISSQQYRKYFYWEMPTPEEEALCIIFGR